MKKIFLGLFVASTLFSCSNDDNNLNSLQEQKNTTSKFLFNSIGKPKYPLEKRKFILDSDNDSWIRFNSGFFGGAIIQKSIEGELDGTPFKLVSKNQNDGLEFNFRGWSEDNECEYRIDNYKGFNDVSSSSVPKSKDYKHLLAILNSQLPIAYVNENGKLKIANALDYRNEHTPMSFTEKKGWFSKQSDTPKNNQ